MLARAVVPVTPGQRLRITASGLLKYDLAPAGCTLVSPRGCASDPRTERVQSLAPAGALIGVFLDARGTPVSVAFFVGEAAVVVVPPGAARLSFRPNLGALVRATGAYAVAAVSIGGYGVEGRRLLGSNGLIPGSRSLGDATAAAVYTRLAAQHLLRRVAFSGSPEFVNAVLGQGPKAWFNLQLTPASIDDSNAINGLEAKPTTTDSKGQLIDADVYERRLVQRQVTTLRQVQEKLVLHWLDHFSVGNGKVRDAAMMSHYEETLRADALGNFKQLLIDVTKEPAMLYWLDNNNNVGANPATNPPNENYSRELMQLYIMGTTKLNQDGSPILDNLGVPINNYTQTDVQTVARLLSGFSVNVQYTAGSDPNTRFSVVFSAARHGSGGARSVIGQTVNDPGDQTCVDVTLDSLIRNPSTAPFQVKELIQRIATENPSPQYVAAIAQVWASTVDAPDQIAQVVKAIVNNQEFVFSYRSMSKEPAEFDIQALRQIPGVLKVGTVGSNSIGPGEDVVGGFGFNGAALQQLYSPPSVFSFYRPGNKNGIVSQLALLQRFDSVADMIAADPAQPPTNTGIDVGALRNRIGSTDPVATANYLLDALVDGQADALRTSLLAYLGTAQVDDTHLRGALWIVMTSPEYQVN